MKASKKELFLIFENNRIEHHYSDMSILQIKNNSYLYVSPKGIKNILTLDQIRKNTQLTKKFQQSIWKLNLYSQQHIYWDLQFQNQSIKKVTKKYKIKEFTWRNVEIQELKHGYQIKSDCGNASLLLRKDLYIVQVSYLQFIKSQRGYIQRIPNMTKHLLQKYNHEYLEFPSTIDQNEQRQYLYFNHSKQFNIFSLPNQWKYPLHLIWNSLEVYKVIPHQYSYVQFSAQQMFPATVMPPLRNTLQGKDVQNLQNGNIQDDPTLPILGKITHRDKVAFGKIQNVKCWFLDFAAFVSDGYGFWMLNEVATYRKFNQPKINYQYYPKAIPHTLRFEKQPERSVNEEINVFFCYIEENLKVLKLQKQKERAKKEIFDNQNRIVRQENMENVGKLKAFSNGIIIGNFVDSTLLTLNCKRMQAKLIKNTGQPCFIDISNTQSTNYYNNKNYLNYAIDFMERVFYPEQWESKQSLNKNIEDVLSITESLQKATSAFLKL